MLLEDLPYLEENLNFCSGTELRRRLFSAFNHEHKFMIHFIAEHVKVIHNLTHFLRIIHHFVMYFDKRSKTRLESVKREAIT